MYVTTSLFVNDTVRFFQGFITLAAAQKSSLSCDIALLLYKNIHQGIVGTLRDVFSVISIYYNILRYQKELSSRHQRDGLCACVGGFSSLGFGAL